MAMSKLDLHFTKINLLKFVLIQNHNKIHKDPPPKLSKFKFARKNKSKKQVDTHLNIKIRAGDAEQVKLLVFQGINVNEPGPDSWRPLHVAVKYRRFKIAKFLIENGAQVNQAILKEHQPGPNNVTGFTPLHVAAMMNQLDTAKLLLENGARVSRNTETFCDPIHIAVFRNHPEMVSLLLNHGAEVNLRYSNMFFTAFRLASFADYWQNQNLPLLHCAILQDHNGMADLLINRGADIHMRTSKGRTTLMQAVEMNNADLVNTLLEKGSNVNDRDNYGQPVLHFTMLNTFRKKSMYCKKDHSWASQKIKVVTRLVEAGADINASFPLKHSRASVIHYMIKYGFDVGVFYLMDQPQMNFAKIDLDTAKSAQLINRYLTQDIKSDQEYLSDLADRFDEIRYFLTQWAIARDIMGLPVDKRILTSPIEEKTFIDDHVETLKAIRECLVTEKQYLMTIKFSDGPETIWDLVNYDLNQLAEVMANPNMMRVMDLLGNSRSEMTYFVNLLFNRMEIVDQRKKQCQ